MTLDVMDIAKFVETAAAEFPSIVAEPLSNSVFLEPFTMVLDKLSECIFDFVRFLRSEVVHGCISRISISLKHTAKEYFPAALMGKGLHKSELMRSPK